MRWSRTRGGGKGRVYEEIQEQEEFASRRGGSGHRVKQAKGVGSKEQRAEKCEGFSRQANRWTNKIHTSEQQKEGARSFDCHHFGTVG